MLTFLACIVGAYLLLRLLSSPPAPGPTDYGPLIAASRCDRARLPMPIVLAPEHEIVSRLTGER